MAVNVGTRQEGPDPGWTLQEAGCAAWHAAASIPAEAQVSAHTGCCPSRSAHSPVCNPQPPWPGSRLSLHAFPSKGGCTHRGHPAHLRASLGVPLLDLSPYSHPARLRVSLGIPQPGLSPMATLHTLEHCWVSPCWASAPTATLCTLEHRLVSPCRNSLSGSRQRQ